MSDLIAYKSQERQRWALRQHSCKIPCSLISDLIASKIQTRLSCALRQHFCKNYCNVVRTFEMTAL